MQSSLIVNIAVHIVTGMLQR